MQTHRIETTRTARYHTYGDAAHARSTWFLLHGYGQLAGEFLASCEALADGKRLLVAPGALSRFYLRAGTGRVGASWMTSEERPEEIADYVRFLDAVAGRLPAGPQEREACAVGFSQGAHTACRWATLGATHVDRLVLWGGGVPPDLDLARGRARLGRMRVTLVRGEADEAYDAAALAHDCARLAEHGIAHEAREFEGAHEMDAAILRHVADT